MKELGQRVFAETIADFVCQFDKLCEAVLEKEPEETVESLEQEILIPYISEILQKCSTSIEEFHSIIDESRCGDSMKIRLHNYTEQIK